MLDRFKDLVAKVNYKQRVKSTRENLIIIYAKKRGNRCFLTTAIDPYSSFHDISEAWNLM